MTLRRFTAFLAGVVGMAALTHAVIAIAAASAVDRLYRHRMYDVRKWPGPPVEDLRLAGTYLRERLVRSQPPITLFAGSSVTHGYPWTQSQTFARRYGDARGESVINAGILGLDISGVNDWILCAAKGNGIHVATLIVELPVVNSVSQLANYHRAGRAAPPLSDCADAAASPGYSAWAWSRPLGIGWLAFLWEEDAYLKRDTVIRIEPVPAGYFTPSRDFHDVAAVYEGQIGSLLANAVTVADRVYAFPSPVFTAGLEQIGEDAVSVRAQGARAVSACRKLSQVRCLDPAFLGERQDYFFNFTHLNQAGHRALAEWLAAQVH